jgi:hypothetical protein
MGTIAQLFGISNAAVLKWIRQETEFIASAFMTAALTHFKTATILILKKACDLAHQHATTRIKG